MMLTKAIRPELTATGDRQPDDLAGRIRVLKNDGDDKNQNTSDRRHPPLCSPCNRIANMTMTTFQGKLVVKPGRPTVNSEAGPTPTHLLLRTSTAAS
jgi:hypothetical protein